MGDEGAGSGDRGSGERESGIEGAGSGDREPPCPPPHF